SGPGNGAGVETGPIHNVACAALGENSATPPSRAPAMGRKQLAPTPAASPWEETLSPQHLRPAPGGNASLQRQRSSAWRGNSPTRTAQARLKIEARLSTDRKCAP